MIALRPYQQTCVDKGVRFFTNDKVSKPKIIVAPTAAGKSIIIAAIAAQLETNVLVLQPSKELLEQNFAKYMLYNSNADVYSASAGRKKIAKVTFATIGSIVKVADLFNNFNALIIDEAHLYPPGQESMFGKFLTANPQLKILGLTATPFRLRTSATGAKLVMMHNSNIYNGYAHIIQIQEIAAQYWSPLEYIIERPDMSILRINTTGVEYTEHSLERFGLQSENSILKYCQTYADVPTLVFVPSVKQAASLAARVPGGAYVCADTKPKERAQIIADFRAGRIKKVFNVNVLSVGFDYPELSVIIDCCPTLSLARHYQKVGRLTRQHPDKKFGTVIDLSGNTDKFGRVEDLEFRQIGTTHHIFSGEKQLTGVYYSNEDFISTSAEKAKPKVHSKFIDLEFKFGKFKGEKISQVPEWYLSWVIDNIESNPKLTDNIRAFLDMEKAKKLQSPSK